MKIRFHFGVAMTTTAFLALSTTCIASTIQLEKILIDVNDVTNSVVQAAFPGITAKTPISLADLVAASATNDFPHISWNTIPDRYINHTDVLDEYDELAKTRPYLTSWSLKNGHTPNAFTNMLNLIRDKFGQTNRADAAQEVGSFGLNPLKNRLDLLAKIVGEIDYDENYRNIIIESYVRSLKIWFRNHGKSFVTKDGINPLKAYMDDLSAALDDPRLGNINELMARIDRSDVVFDMSFLPDDAWVEETKQKVLIDDIPFDSVKKKLRMCLGVEEYNKFVDLYNNGVTNP